MEDTLASVIVANKKAKSEVWRYFGFPGDHSEAITKKKVDVCRLCDNKNEFPYAGNTTNLVTHLERHHKSEYSEYLRASGKIESGSASSSKQVTLETALSRVQPLSGGSTRKKELDQAIGYYIAADMQPMSAVEDKGFIRLMKVAEP